MASRKGSSTGRLILIFFLVGGCLLLVLAAIISQGLPRAAARAFGSPSSGLSGTQQILYSVRLMMNQNDLTIPADSFGEARPFTIQMGESVGSIASRLENQGLVRNAEAFRIYMVYAGLDTTVQAGNYEISPTLNAIDIAHSLQDATPQEVRFNVLAGWRIEEVAAALPTSGIQLQPDDLLRAAREPFAQNLPPGFPQVDHLEGFIYPGTYQFERTISADGMLAAFLERFDENVTPELRAGFERQGLDLYEAVILASIVEREAIVEEEAPMIASVFLNRLRIGMKLDSDPTIQYAVGYNSNQATWWTNPLTLDDIATISPYNTYNQAGLPPGPICSPGAAAYHAVAFPAQSPYYFFRARCDGSGKHNFSVSYAEHLEYGCE
jgi:UPF0755 protein